MAFQVHAFIPNWDSYDWFGGPIRLYEEAGLTRLKCVDLGDDSPPTAWTSAEEAKEATQEWLKDKSKVLNLAVSSYITEEDENMANDRLLRAKIIDGYRLCSDLPYAVENGAIGNPCQCTDDGQEAQCDWHRRGLVTR